MSLNRKILKYQSKLQSTIQTSPKYSSYMNKYMYYVSKNNNNVMKGGNYNCESLESLESLKCIETTNGIHKTKADCENNCNKELMTLHDNYMKLYNEMRIINYKDKNYNTNTTRLAELKKEYEKVFNLQQIMKNKEKYWEYQNKNNSVTTLMNKVQSEIQNEQKGNYAYIIQNIRLKILKSKTLLEVFTDLDNLEKEKLIELRLKKIRNAKLDDTEEKVIESYLKLQDTCKI